MKIVDNKNSNDILDYMEPEQWRESVKIHKLFPAIPRFTENIKFDIFDFDALFNDEATNDLIRKGNTIGCFYIESPGMRSLLKKLDVHTFEMLTAASSIIRPGVAESGMMREFIERHKNPARRNYFIPELADHLKETYGVMIYQEDVIKIAHYIAGLSLEEADLLRRAMSGKMRSHKAMKDITDKFFSSCRKQNSYLENKQVKELWRQIESFAGYSFCKAHSASFALLSYQVAFLKAHYPAEFMASVLSNGGGFYSSAVYIQECKRLGLQVKLPCINKSNYEYTGSGKIIRIGLMAIKNISNNSIETTISERKQNGNYISLADFLIRTKLGYEETSALIKCGAMDNLKETRPTLLRLLDIYINRRKILDQSYNNLFINETFDLEDKIKTDLDYGVEERCQMEHEYFHYMVTKHPLYFFGKLINHPSIIKAQDMNKHKGKNVKMIGWYMTSKRIKTRKGNIMKFLSLEDLTGTFEAVIFPKVYERVAENTMSMGPYLLKGKIDTEEGTNNIIVDDLKIISQASFSVKLSEQKDSVENKYYGDVEKVTEEEFQIVKSLGKEKLRRAYAS